jgi:hypothetical protein
LKTRENCQTTDSQLPNLSSQLQLCVLCFSILEVEEVVNIPNITGWLREIEYYIHNLMSGDNDTAFLVIEISGTEDFIQFLKDDEGVQLDFPLLTDRQKQLEERLRQEALVQNLELLENNGTDGMQFLNMTLKGSSSEVAQSIESLLINIFGVNANTMLGFEMDV